LLTPPVGTPPNEVWRSFANFTYQAGRSAKARRVVANVEWHPGELYPRVGFVVRNMARPAEGVIAFYNKRGTCEQWVKEGKGAMKWRAFPVVYSPRMRFVFNFMRWPTISVISFARWRRQSRSRTGR
jgi:Transposase DDE domain group 1